MSTLNIDPEVAEVTLPKFAPEAYYGLLTDPEGTYQQGVYGDTIAFILKGSDEFRRRAINLFSSFDIGITRQSQQSREYTYHTNLSVHPGREPDSCFFCLPTHRARAALTLYFYTQLYKDKGVKKYIKDNDGDLIDIVLENEDELNREADLLAQSFISHYIPVHYGNLPARLPVEPTNRDRMERAVFEEYRVAEPQTNESEDSNEEV